MQRNTWMMALVAVAAIAIVATVPALAHGPEDRETSPGNGGGWQEEDGHHGAAMMGHGHMMGLADPVTLERVAETLGLTLEELEARLDGGETIAEVATDLGLDPALVVDTILAPQVEMLQVLVKYGYLTEEEAEQVLETARLGVERAIEASPGDYLGGCHGGDEAGTGAFSGGGRTWRGGWSGRMGGGAMGRGMMGGW